MGARPAFPCTYLCIMYSQAALVIAQCRFDRTLGTRRNTSRLRSRVELVKQEDLEHNIGIFVDREQAGAIILQQSQPQETEDYSLRETKRTIQGLAVRSWLQLGSRFPWGCRWNPCMIVQFDLRVAKGGLVTRHDGEIYSTTQKRVECCHRTTKRKIAEGLGGQLQCPGLIQMTRGYHAQSFFTGRFPSTLLLNYISPNVRQIPLLNTYFYADHCHSLAHL